jgi:hypothetical protein
LSVSDCGANERRNERSAHRSIALIIKISADELAPLGDKTIQLRDKSAYIVEPAVYHELHCIVSRRPPPLRSAD